jgi:predicted ABC-type transport system involved in lysophospholipase L1 biosynthesis ATPase subunit
VDLNERGNTIVLITHDAHVASFARRRLDFCDGRIQSDHRSARA